MPALTSPAKTRLYLSRNSFAVHIIVILTDIRIGNDLRVSVVRFAATRESQMKWPGLPTIIGLLLALGGPVALAGHWGGISGSKSSSTKDQIVLWAVLTLVITIIIFGEGHLSIRSACVPPHGQRCFVE